MAGLKENDLKPKTLDEFKDESVSDKIQNLRFRHHQHKLQQRKRLVEKALMEVRKEHDQLMRRKSPGTLHFI